MPLLILRYDLRLPPDGATPTAVTGRGQYAACLEQCKWGDRLGLDMVVVSEHHGAPDSFMSAPITLAAAILGATERIPVNISALLAIMHDPLRIAEQLATIDLIAPGRLSAILGTGYRQEEFDFLGIEFKDRNALLEEHVTALRQAWTGEYFEYRGRKVRVTPTPATPGGPMLMLGGSSEQAARRAARLRCVFTSAIGDQSLGDAYYDECAKVGFQGYASLPHGAGFIHVSLDPERDWQRIAPYAFHEARTYASWQRTGQSSSVTVKHADTVDDLKASGVYQVITPDEFVAQYQGGDPFGGMVLHPLMGGIPPELAWESLELIEHDVLPRIRPV